MKWNWTYSLCLVRGVEASLASCRVLSSSRTSWGHRQTSSVWERLNDVMSKHTSKHLHNSISFYSDFFARANLCESCCLVKWERLRCPHDSPFFTCATTEPVVHDFIFSLGMFLNKTFRDRNLQAFSRPPRQAGSSSRWLEYWRVRRINQHKCTTITFPNYPKWKKCPPA